MIYAGIDLAKGEHVIGAIDEPGVNAVKPVSFPNSTDGFDRRRSTSKVWASLRNPRSSAWRRSGRSSSPSPASATSSALGSSPR